MSAVVVNSPTVRLPEEEDRQKKKAVATVGTKSDTDPVNLRFAQLPPAPDNRAPTERVESTVRADSSVHWRDEQPAAGCNPFFKARPLRPEVLAPRDRGEISPEGVTTLERSVADVHEASMVLRAVDTDSHHVQNTASPSSADSFKQDLSRARLPSLAAQVWKGIMDIEGALAASRADPALSVFDSLIDQIRQLEHQKLRLAEASALLVFGGRHERHSKSIEKAGELFGLISEKQRRYEAALLAA